MFSEAELAFARGGIVSGVRADGRGAGESRLAAIETGIFPTCNGSARVVRGAGESSDATTSGTMISDALFADAAPVGATQTVGFRTDVVVGVKVEAGPPAEAAPDDGRLQVSVQFSPVCPPLASFSGRDRQEQRDVGEQLAADLQLILRGSGALDLSSLGILRGKASWVLYVDCIVLDGSGGNVLDTISLGIRAALHDVRLPHVEVNSAGDDFEVVSWQADSERATVESEADEGRRRDTVRRAHTVGALATSNIPVSATFACFGDLFVVDPDPLEASSADALFVVAVVPASGGEGAKICYCQQGGTGCVSLVALRAMMAAGVVAGTKILRELEDALAAADRRKHAAVVDRVSVPIFHVV